MARSSAASASRASRAIGAPLIVKDDPVATSASVLALPSPPKRPHAPKPCAQNAMSLVAFGALSGAFVKMGDVA